MASASLTKIINCKKNDLINMVLDIEKYPEFVPWCIKGKTHSVKDKGEYNEIIADLTIGKGYFKETYKSFIIHNKKEDFIKVTNIDGPLNYLKNEWFFEEKNKSTQVKFNLNFELKNKFLDLLMSKSFKMGLEKIATAFELRANQLFKQI